MFAKRVFKATVQSQSEIKAQLLKAAKPPKATGPLSIQLVGPIEDKLLWWLKTPSVSSSATLWFFLDLFTDRSNSSQLSCTFNCIVLKSKLSDPMPSALSDHSGATAVHYTGRWQLLRENGGQKGWKTICS